MYLKHIYTHTHICFTEIKIGYSFRWFNWSVGYSKSYQETVQVTKKKKKIQLLIQHIQISVSPSTGTSPVKLQGISNREQGSFSPHHPQSNTARNMVMFLVRNWKQNISVSRSYYSQSKKCCYCAFTLSNNEKLEEVLPGYFTTRSKPKLNILH